MAHWRYRMPSLSTPRGGAMQTGFLHVDGNEALGREPAKPHHWVTAFAAVVVAQWFMWQASALTPLIASSTLMFGFADANPTFAYVAANIFFLLVPTAIFGFVALRLSRQFDNRGARAIGLDAKTLPLTIVWALAGVIAAAPHIVAIMLSEPDYAQFGVGLAVLTPVTIIQAGAEEILFRGIILGMLCARYGVRNGVIISALLFGLWHVYAGQPTLDMLVMFITTFIFGVTSAVLTLHFGNIGPALGLHIVWNVAGYLSGAAGVGGEDFWSSWVTTFSAVWRIDDFITGDILRLLIIPLTIETLLIFGACRETVNRLLNRSES